MKPKTKTLLSKLSESESRASLLALWSDIKSCELAEFEEFLNKTYTPQQKKAGAGGGRKKKSRSLPTDDLPVTRIAHSIRLQGFASDNIAIEKLSNALIERGINPSAIPAASTEKLETWLENLIKFVSESTVLAVAQKIRV